MRKLDTSAITGTIGMPIKSGTLTHLQDAYTEAMAAIMQSQIHNYDANIVYLLYGCVPGTALISVGPGEQMLVATMSAGAIFYNGEVIISPAQDFSDIGQMGDVVVAYINTSYFTDPTADPVTFTDGIARNVHQIKTVSYAIATPGSGVANRSDFASIFPSWSSAGIVLNTNPAVSNVGTPNYNLSYLLENNKVELCGQLTLNASSTGSIVCAKLPANIMPASVVLFSVPIVLNSAPTAPLIVNGEVDPSGNLLVYNPSLIGAITIHLDNISYRLK